jgi:hypothetical protein
MLPNSNPPTTFHLASYISKLLEIFRVAFRVLFLIKIIVVLPLVIILGIIVSPRVAFISFAAGVIL